MNPRLPPADVFGLAPSGPVAARLAGAGAATLLLSAVLLATGPRSVFAAGACIYLVGLPATLVLERWRPTVRGETVPRRYAVTGAVLGVAVWAILAALDASYGLIYVVAVPGGVLAGWFGARMAFELGTRTGGVIAAAGPLVVLAALVWDLATAI